MLLIYKYVDFNYQKETYSIHILKRGKYVESIENLNKQAFELVMKRTFKDSMIATITNVNNKTDLQYKDCTVSDFI